MELPVRHLVISERQRRLLNKNLWTDQFVDAYYVSGGVREPVKVRYRGGHTREYKKKSYEIVRKGKTVHFNAEYDDPSMMRNALSFRFFEMIGVPSPKTRHCILKINGKSAGLYLEIEAVDRYFFGRRNIPVQSLVYATNDDANFGLISPETRKRKASLFDGYKLMIGGGRDRLALTQFISRLHTMKPADLYPYLMRRLDLDNYLRWLAGAVLTGNYDGFNQNYALYRHKRRNKYLIIPWDYEGTWGRDSYGRLSGADPVPVTGYNLLTKKLLYYPSVRKKYKAILQAILNQAFTVKRLEPVIRQMYSGIAPALRTDRTRRWPSSVYSREPRLMLNYIQGRRRVLLKEMEKL
ncbi:CotH kinase family protein [Paenibacillus sp. P26]|nr:CotH kinase family protein [Paenibacillus sp. P26]